MPAPTHGDTERAPPNPMQGLVLHLSPNVVEYEASGGHAISLHVGIDGKEQHKECDTKENRSDKRHIWEHK